MKTLPCCICSSRPSPSAWTIHDRLCNLSHGSYKFKLKWAFIVPCQAIPPERFILQIMLAEPCSPFMTILTTQINIHSSGQAFPPERFILQIKHTGEILPTAQNNLNSNKDSSRSSTGENLAHGSKQFELKQGFMVLDRRKSRPQFKTIWTQTKINSPRPAKNSPTVQNNLNSNKHSWSSTKPKLFRLNDSSYKMHSGETSPTVHDNVNVHKSVWTRIFTSNSPSNASAF